LENIFKECGGNMLKNCKTCGHRYGSLNWGKCLKTGYYISTQRMHPTGGCDKDFSGWVQQLTMKEKFQNFMTKYFGVEYE